MWIIRFVYYVIQLDQISEFWLSSQIWALILNFYLLISMYFKLGKFCTLFGKCTMESHIHVFKIIDYDQLLCVISWF